MLIHRANRYFAEPDAAQHAALVKWVGACRHVYNLGLEQRCDFGRGRRLDYVLQARELTMLRAEVDWLKAAPVHATWEIPRSAEGHVADTWHRPGELPPSLRSSMGAGLPRSTLARSETSWQSFNAASPVR